MGNGFWNKREAGRLAFGDKALMAKAGTPFRIVAANHRGSNNPEYGAQLVLTCEAITDGTDITDELTLVQGGKFSIGLSWNETRAQMHVELTEAIADGEVIEAELYTFKAKGGTAYDIRPAGSKPAF